MRPTREKMRGVVLVFALLGAGLLASCGNNDMAEWVKRPTESAMPGGRAPAPPEVDAGRISGRIRTSTPNRAVPLVREEAKGDVVAQGSGARARSGASGEITLNYVDTDVREVVRLILGDVLKLNYTIEPEFRGTVTIRTARPLRRDELIPTLQSLLASVGGSMTLENGIFRIHAADEEGGVPPVVDASSAGSGSQVVRLKFASARQLGAMLTPYVGEGARLVVDTARNVLVVSGAPAARQNIIDLIRIFDVDYLASQSYALYPVKTGDPVKAAADLQAALQADADGALAGSIRVVPIETANAILVIAQQSTYLDRASRVMAQLETVRESAGRNLHVIYLKNAQANDLQPILQKAINPPAGAGGAVAETAPGSLAPGAAAAQVASAASASSSPSAARAGGIAAANPATTNGGTVTPTSFGNETSAASPNSSAAGSSGESQQQVTGAPKGAQIIADVKNNALIVVATESEYAMVEAAVRRLDILPLQVLIEATVAEVTLNDTLQYGTQFFFTNHGYSQILTNAQSSAPTVIDPANPLTNAQLFQGLLAPAFPGLAIARTMGGAQFALEALKQVTDVRVISSPKLLIVDRQRARLQVGDLVPIITQNQQSVTAPGAPIVQNIQYQETGVILTVTPRINTGGLVTLDIEQEVSNVTTPASQVQSPTFSQRKITSKVVIQDGETISLAGLISDRQQRDKNGIPVLQDIPVLGSLFSTRGSSDQRTELLVLITPKVIYDQQSARAMTDELRRKLAPGALVQ
jgi:general secretion pathway protein D